jgi:hypothetical protein
MSKRQKAIEQLRQHPKAVRFAEVDCLLLGLGFEKCMRRTSHAYYTLGTYQLSIPFRKPFILPYYVGRVLEVLDQMDEPDEADPED